MFFASSATSYASVSGVHPHPLLDCLARIIFLLKLVAALVSHSSKEDCLFFYFGFDVAALQHFNVSLFKDITVVCADVIM
jgi:hypothetical protein